MEVKKPSSCIGQSTSDEKLDKINDWNYQIDMLLPKMSRHCVAPDTFFSVKEQQKFCCQWPQPKKFEMHDHLDSCRPTMS
jgi:hypothetical protein